MDLLNHIPFGLRKEDQKYVDVADVPKGRACACICPSCHIPLIARKGTVNRWHFAHSGRKTEGPDNGCEYSFFVSVRAMAKQIVENEFRLSTPGCTGHVSEHRHGMLYTEPFSATKPGTVTLGNIQKECLFEETMVDICGEVNGFPLVIYFSHPDRSVPFALEEPGNTRCGILEIDLTWTRALFLSKKATFDRFGDEIRTFIEGSNHAKKWIYHPRKLAAMSKARSRLEKQMMNWVPPQQRKYVRKNPYVRFERGGNQHYECLICKTRWSGFENEKQVCPVCQLHLYVHRIVVVK
ncbi:TPA: hypothetical protein QHX34_002684 [Klebsiella aerogenes]|nr:hypothetical protein [Klebsiella aerogenes]